MSTLPRGLHETLLTEALVRALEGHPDPESVVRRPLRAADAADRLALHVARVVERALDDLPADERVHAGTEIVRRLLATLAAQPASNDDAPVAPAHVLEAVLGRRPDGRPEEIGLPHIPLLDTTLLTNAPGEPNLHSQILTEIASADRIDAVIASIRRSGSSQRIEVGSATV